MITVDGYSKEPGLQAEGLVLTLPKIFFEDRCMTIPDFKKMFEEYMVQEDAVWNFRLTNLPTQEVPYIYLIFGGFLQYRANFMQYERNVAKEFDDAPDGIIRSFDFSNWILFTGPVIKCPFVRELKGFQGFRYSTKLF